MHPLQGLTSSPCSHPDIVSDVSGTGLAPGSREDAVQGCLGDCPRFGSQLLQLSFPGGKGDGGLASRDRPLSSPERVCSANSIKDGDHRGGFPGFHRSGACVLPDTRSSVFEEPIEVPVDKDSLSVQGPVLRAVDCLSSLHQVVAVVSAWAHSHVIRLLRYLDDWLVPASSETEAKKNIQDLLSLCHSLGIVINKKSDLVPSQTANYLCMIIYTGAARIFPSLARVEKFLLVAETFCAMFAPPA